MQLEALLSIQSGDNPRILILKLNSFVDFGFEESLKKYNEL